MDTFITVARYNELSALWEAEDFGDPDSFWYRDTLTESERKLVTYWDTLFVKKKP